jgi:hypothetical protein
MAKPQENPSANKQNNSSARRQVILDVCADLASLEARRGEITEEISSLKSQRIKGDLGMKISDFNAAYRLYRLEDADRDIFLDTLRETFEALGVGGQLDFIKAGEKAGKAGKPFDSNPYPKDTPANKSWAEAWEAAQANNLKDLGTGAPAH